MSANPVVHSLIASDDLQVLARAADGLAELLGLLAEERRAIATLQGEALLSISSKKEQIAAELAGLARAAPGSAPTRRSHGSAAAASRARIRDAAARVSALAHANAALVGDALAAIADTLGLREGEGTYDRRARKRARLRSLGGTPA